MRLYAALVSEATDQPATQALQGLGRAMAQMDRLDTMVDEAWRAMQTEFQAHPVTSAQYLFLAPEYFFSNRRSAKDRFFSHDVKRATIDRLRALSRTYPKMLLVPGTILWTKPVYDARLRVLGRGQSTVEYTLYQARDQKAGARIQAAARFGTETKALGWSHSRTVQTFQRKLAQNVAYLCLDGHIVKYQKVGNFEEVMGEADDLTFVPGSIVGRFSVGNVRYAIEVCMDHALGVFDSTVPGQGTVDVELVVSSFVTMKQNSSASVTLHASTEAQQTYVDPNDNKSKTLGTAQIRFAGDGRARLAGPPIKKTGFTVWTVDIDGTYAGANQIRDTALQTVPEH